MEETETEKRERAGGKWGDGKWQLVRGKVHSIFGLSFLLEVE